MRFTAIPCPVQPKTEELLYYLLWSADQLLNPTFRNLDGSFESWIYRNGFSRQIAQLEKQRLIERKSSQVDSRVYRLTAVGRLRALGGRDPAPAWARPWDGRWRLVLFDLPTSQSTQRSRLRRYLRERGFGFLQNSVWTTPDPLDDEIRLLRGAKINVESFLLLEARPCAGESDAEIVAGAWDFGRINRLYSKHLKILAEKPASKRLDGVAARALRRWAGLERAAWAAALSSDPLLPARLLPPGYLGQKAWRNRAKILREARRDLAGFTE